MFTGAGSDRTGKFELADAGTLFLDEIGELPLSIQAKLLRVIQEGEIQRVGSEKMIRVDAARDLGMHRSNLHNLATRLNLRQKVKQTKQGR